MNKTERLILLLKHLGTRGPMTLKEISDQFSVSERTAYRDLSTLTNLGFKLNTNESSFIEKKQSIGDLGEFDDTEIRLLVFALRTNALGKIFPFEQLAQKIEYKFGPKHE